MQGKPLHSGSNLDAFQVISTPPSSPKQKQKDKNTILFYGGTLNAGAKCVYLCLVSEPVSRSKVRQITRLWGAGGGGGRGHDT